jgi:hypothetical protein
VLDAFPAAPAGAKDVVYVSAGCAEGSADGTKEHPYATISAALTAAAKGATVIVAPGTYAENLTIERDVTVIGPNKPGAKGDEAGIILQAPAPYAITAKGGAAVTLRGFSVKAPAGVGIWAKGASVTVDASRVEGAKADGKGQFGYGVLAADAGAIILQDSAVVGSALAGVLVSGGTGSVSASDVSRNGKGGIRLDAASAPVTIQGTTLTANTSFGIGVFSSGAIILQNEVRDTVADATGAGDGLVSAQNDDGAGNLGVASSISGKDNLIAESARVGVLCAQGAGGIILQNNQISGTGAHASFGAGIWLQQGAGGVAGNVIEANTVSGSHFVGVGLSGDTHGIILQNNTIRGTLAGTAFVGVDQVSIGDGINAFQGASAAITGNTVSGSARFGIVLDAVAAAMSLSGNTIEKSDDVAIILQNQADQPTIGANTFLGNGTDGLKTIGAGEAAVGIVTADFALK